MVFLKLLSNWHLSAMQPSTRRQQCLMLSVFLRKAYITSWFLLDIVACLPLECILANAATTVNFYNTPKLIRWGRMSLFVYHNGGFVIEEHMV